MRRRRLAALAVALCWVSAPAAGTDPPSATPSTAPTAAPTAGPSGSPAAAGGGALPTSSPQPSPTAAPAVPGALPPSGAPTAAPTAPPTAAPTVPPTGGPATPGAPPPTAGPARRTPSASPTEAPSRTPAQRGAALPSVSPTATPTAGPSAGPSAPPTGGPVGPTAAPTASPTSPTSTPTARPTGPTASPTAGPTAPTASPTAAPTAGPTATPTAGPASGAGSPPTTLPSASPTGSPVAPSSPPTVSPTDGPAVPSVAPSHSPLPDGHTRSPTNATADPTAAPSVPPTSAPTSPPEAAAPEPTPSPSANPTVAPTLSPTSPTATPSAAPSGSPTPPPPTRAPSLSPTGAPTHTGYTYPPTAAYVRSPALRQCCPEHVARCGWEPVDGYDESVFLGEARALWPFACNNSNANSTSVVECQMLPEDAFEACAASSKCCSVMERGKNHSSDGLYSLGKCPSVIESAHGLGIDHHVCVRVFSPLFGFCPTIDGIEYTTAAPAGIGSYSKIPFTGNCSGGSPGADNSCKLPRDAAVARCAADPDCCSLTEDIESPGDLLLNGCDGFPDYHVVPFSTSVGICGRVRNPTASPSTSPSAPPTTSPAGPPTVSPTDAPARNTSAPSVSPVLPPTEVPTAPTTAPSAAPTQQPTHEGYTHAPSQLYLRSPVLGQCCPAGQSNCGWEQKDGYDEAVALGSNRSQWPFNCDAAAENATECRLPITDGFDVCAASPNCCGVTEEGENTSSVNSTLLLGACPTSLQPNLGLAKRFHVCMRSFSPLRGFCKNSGGTSYTASPPAGPGTWSKIPFTGDCPGRSDPATPCMLGADAAMVLCNSVETCCSLTEDVDHPGQLTLGGCEGYPSFGTVTGAVTLGSCAKSLARTEPPTTAPTASPSISPVAPGTCASYFLDGNTCSPPSPGLVDAPESLNCSAGQKCTQDDEVTCCRTPYQCFATEVEYKEKDGSIQKIETTHPCTGAFWYDGSIQWSCAASSLGRPGGTKAGSTEIVPNAALQRYMLDNNITECPPGSGCSWCFVDLGIDPSDGHHLVATAGSCRCANTPAPETPSPLTPSPETPAPETPAPPTVAPSASPLVPTASPTLSPQHPSVSPTAGPSSTPSVSPSASPRFPSVSPTDSPYITETLPLEIHSGYGSSLWYVWVVLGLLLLSPLGAAWKVFAARRTREMRSKQFGEWMIDDLIPAIQSEPMELESVLAQCSTCGSYAPGGAMQCTTCHDSVRRVESTRPLNHDEKELMGMWGGFGVWKASVLSSLRRR